MLLPNAMHH